MTYYLFFLLYLSLGVATSAALFWWAVRNGQFTGQARAAYLPLEGEEPLETPGPAAARWTPAAYGTAAAVVMWAALFAAALVLMR
jgi:cbb3-type cytochrome oxidase maturation protein